MAHTSMKWIVAAPTAAFLVIALSAEVPWNSGKASFYAHKNGEHQPGLITGEYTTVTWPSTYFNVGNYFDTTSNYWTPPEGPIQLNAWIWQREHSGTSKNASFVVKIQRFNAITISEGSPAIFNWPKHNLSVGQPVQFAARGTLPAPMVSLTVYYVESIPSPNTFTIAKTRSASAINTTSSSSAKQFGYADVCAGVGVNSTAFPDTASVGVSCISLANGLDHYITNYYYNSDDGKNSGVIDGNPAHSHFSGAAL
jgi:hypothetical protein